MNKTKQIIKKEIGEGKLRPVFKHYRTLPWKEPDPDITRSSVEGEYYQDEYIAHYPADKDQRWFKPEPRGGKTVCYLYVVGGSAIAGVGAAYCSMKDQFCYATGRKIALDRAIHDLAEHME